MKKILPIFLVLLLLSGCKIKTYTPEIPVSFQQNAQVTSGDFSFSCKICKSEGKVAVTVTSTSASGMVMTYDGDKLNFLYDDFSYDIDGSNFEKNNIAILIYDVFEYIENTDELSVRKIDTGYKYEGSVSCGDFILIQNNDNSLSSLTLRTGDMKVEFEQ